MPGSGGVWAAERCLCNVDRVNSHNQVAQSLRCAAHYNGGIMKIAALRALSEDDIENALVATRPGGIERQEAEGQKDFVANQTLPIHFNSGAKEDLELYGLVFGNEVDDLFQQVQLPEGWRKKGTDHSMWSSLLDEQGRARAMLFYRAAFYNRSAHIDLVRLFSRSVEPADGFEDPECENKNWRCVVKRGGQIVWESETIGPRPGYGSDDREGNLDWVEKRRVAESAGIEWLDENFPEWESVTAYWND